MRSAFYIGYIHLRLPEKAARWMAIAVAALWVLCIAVIAQGASPADAEDLSNNEIRHRIRVIEGELAKLPKRSALVSGGTQGYRSREARESKPAEPKWLAIDLGAVQPIEHIVLVPALLMDAEGREIMYGFPKSFRVQVSETQDFGDDAFVRRFKKLPLAEGVCYPLAIECALPNARWIRILVEEMDGSPVESENYYFALSEVLVFNQGRNLALVKPVIALDAGNYWYRWSPEYVVDGYMTFSQPQSAPPRANGYKSVSFYNPDTVVELTLDLGGVHTIDEIRMYPDHSYYQSMTVHGYGLGFPNRFRIEASQDPAFKTSSMLADHWEHAYPTPVNKTVMFAVPSVKARYVKLAATDFSSRITRPNRRENRTPHFLSLAEFEVFSRGTPISRDCGVEASIPANSERHPKEELVDGLLPQGPIRPLESFLLGLAKRGPLNKELAKLESALAFRMETQEKRLQVLAWVLGLTVTAAFTVFMMSQWFQRRKIRALRERIAADLHDEIGSNLGSIALLSDQLAQCEAEDGEKRSSMNEISLVARETAQSMRDIVWLLGPFAQPEELPSRLRETAHLLLRGAEYTFSSDERIIFRKLSIEQCRQLFLFYKEALHNIARHAQAEGAEIVFSAEQDELVLRIIDDGAGFDLAARKDEPDFLHKLRSRANKLHATLNIHSKPAEGTLVELRFRP